MVLKKTKTVLFILIGCLLLFVGCNNAYGQKYWMQRAGSSTIDEANGISLDDSSNTYTTGYFTNTAKFGLSSLTALGISDIFITKTNSSGVYQWAVKAGDGGSDRGLAIKTDSKGNSYVTGFYSGIAKFGVKTITSAGLQDVFVARYDRNGNLVWVVSAGGTQADIGNAINVDNNGNVVITGEFAGTAKFGTFTLNSTAGNVNVFTAKLDSATGNFIWAKSGVGPHTDRGLGIACDPSGNVYVTGQFTDTITFDNNHYTNLYNAIFLIKYNSSGKEQWFTYAGGGSFSIANGIAVNRKSEIYLTGDFTGGLTFFVTPAVTITNKYANRIFVAKYDQNANLLWATSDGSSNPVTSRSISVDSLGNAYILGNFECIMNSYADQYGQGTFNTVGDWDIFSAGYSSGGSWQWSRQIGGHLNNYGNSIAVNSKGEIFTAGSFDQDMIVPYNPSNFLGYNTTNACCCNSTYCSDSYYGDFSYFNTAGNLDIFIAKPIDLSRETYDYYVRTGSGCDRPREGVCIDPGCPDTVQFCGGGSISANTYTCSPEGPNFTYLWSNKQTGNSIYVSMGGWYSVTQTTVDGCFQSTDSIFVIIHPLPPQPNISDNVVINTNATNPKPIHVCADSVKLTGGGYGSNSYYWSDGSTATTVSIEAKKSGTYCFNIVDSLGCKNYTCVTVTLDSALPPIKPKLKCLSCKDDTVAFCKGGSFSMLAYDSITNPTANPSLCIPPGTDTYNYWDATPDTIYYSNMTTCPDENGFTPVDTGWFYITDSIVRRNLCDTLVNLVKDSVYVRLYPVPVIGPISITGKTPICPGDSTLIIAHDTSKFVWSNGSTQDSLWVKSGNYSITSSITNKYGCSASAYASISVTYKVPPTITVSPSNGLICPGDSLMLVCSGGKGTYEWEGPSGPVGGNSNFIYVSTPGYYYCIVNDTSYCAPVLSNTVLVNVYATPYIAVSPNPVLCPGDSVQIAVISSPGSTIEWQAPLSGSDSVKTIRAGGTYTCKVTSCGITTVASITITMSVPVAVITDSTSQNFCEGDSVTLMGNNGASLYLWTPGGASTQFITVTQSGTYTLTTTNSYGCKASDTAVVTVTPNNISLPVAPDTSVCPGNTVTLAASGMGSIVWFDSNGVPVGYGNTYTTPGISTPTVYYVQVDVGDCKSIKVPVDVGILDCSGVYIPNIFTPNGDGYNDVWHVTIPGARCYECHIYNRWGVLVYISNDINAGWDGIIRQTGKKASDGVYYYILHYCNYQNSEFKKDGFIQLISSKR